MSAMLDREVLELLREDPDLLAIADAVVVTQRAEPQRRGGTWRLLGVAAVAAVAAVIAAVAPWHGHGNGLIDRALAAVGHGRVLHAVIESDAPNEQVVNLATGAVRPVHLQLEYWYDSDRRSLRAVTRVEGRVRGDEVSPPNRPGVSGEPLLDPALTGFLTGYRDALKQGHAHEDGRGVFDEHRVIWLRFAYRLFGERVGVDEHTYRPVVIEPLDADGTRSSQIWKVAAIDTRAYRRRDFTRSGPRPSSTSVRSLSYAMIDPSRAARILGWPPLWLGASFGALPLQYTEYSTLVREQPLPRQTTRALVLAYGRTANRIQLTEAEAVEAASWLRGLGLPAPGTALVLRPSVTGSGLITSDCQALVHTRGVWVQIEGWNQSSSRCIEAARALVRITP